MQRRNLFWELVEHNPHESWNWYFISKNPNVTENIMKNNMDKNWNWYYLSSHPNLTWNVVKENLGKDWHWYSLSQHKNITWDIIKDNLDKPWNWFSVTKNPNITWDIVKNNQDKNWDYFYIYTCSNFVKNIIKEDPKKANCIYFVKERPKEKNFYGIKSKMTLNYINENKDKVDWSYISANEFFLDNNAQIIQINYRNYKSRTYHLRKRHFKIKMAILGRPPSKNFLGGLNYLKMEKELKKELES